MRSIAIFMLVVGAIAAAASAWSFSWIVAAAVAAGAVLISNELWAID